MRTAHLTRETKETRIDIALAPTLDIVIPYPFFSHMLTAFCTYANLTVSLKATGDLRHHLIEDVALALGEFVKRQTPASAARYGERTIPMDDALVQSVIDVGGRPYFEGTLPSRLYTHWFRSFASASGSTLHLRVLRGTDRHHIHECAFKATGLALRQAIAVGNEAVFSTKGSVRLDYQERESK
jgi:imidazoleglycerol-phosphate dehydratase